MEGEIIGAIKIKDGLFIGDEYAAKVIPFLIEMALNFRNIGFGICYHEQDHTRHQLCRKRT